MMLMMTMRTHGGDHKYNELMRTAKDTRGIDLQALRRVM
jgi:hypothetical protein